MPRLLIAFVAVVALSFAPQANAQNAYYGSQRKLPARAYSGVYSPYPSSAVRTFSLPVYGGGGYVAPRFGRGFYPSYRQPVIVYPPAYYYGY